MEGTLNEITLSTVLWASVGGILPALIWLWFWLKEDSRHPEPKKLIFVAFIGGMIAVPIALLLEQMVSFFVVGTVALFLLWATIEELLKYGAAYVVAFRKECIDKSKCLDETIDPIIYMITAALGFAALENTLFLIAPLSIGEPLAGFITGNLRFVGATVLHVVTSASIGVAMGLSFYKSVFFKKIYVLIGIFTAIVLHTMFNLSIIESNGKNLLIIFGFLWIGVFVLLAIFEKIKKIRGNINL